MNRITEDIYPASRFPKAKGCSVHGSRACFTLDQESEKQIWSKCRCATLNIFSDGYICLMMRPHLFADDSSRDLEIGVYQDEEKQNVIGFVNDMLEADPVYSETECIDSYDKLMTFLQTH